MKLGLLKLRHKILIYILPTSVLAMIICSVFAVSYTKQILLNNYADQKIEITANVSNSIELIDSGYLILEQNLEDDMAEAIQAFKNAYEEAGGDPELVSLEKIKEDIGEDFDLMIINKETTIIKSTTKDALDFNFMSFDKNLGQVINEIRLSSSIHHERIRTNVGTGYLSKFSYVSSNDNQYVLELAYNKGGLETMLEELDPMKKVAELKEISPIVGSIKIYDVFGYEFVDGGVRFEPTPETLSTVVKVIKERDYEVTEGNLDKRYFFIDLDADGHDMTDSSKIVEIVYDRSSLINKLQELSFLIYTACFLMAFAIIIIIFFMSRKITKPITILSSIAKKVAIGDYEVTALKTSSDEIGELTDIFNTMVGEIRGNFEKIEKQKTELEDYSRNLENMVKERTLELANTLEESKKTQALLTESNIQFENLFNNMQEGFAIQEMICDEQGNPVDYIITKANRAFLKFSGTSEKNIKNIMEFKPNTTKEWIETCGKVATTGEPYFFERYYPEKEKYYSVHLFCPARGKCALLYTDITNQIRSNEEIKKEKYILERILEDTLSGYWDWNLVDNTEYLSPGFKKMLGYEDYELVSAPETWQRLIVQEDLPGVMECFNKHIESRGKVPFYNEVRYQHKSGSIVWVICSGHVVEWDSNNRPLQMVGSHINITNIKNLEKSLSEERELLKATLLSIGDGVISTDSNGNIEIMNAIAENLTGWSQDEALGKPFDVVFHIRNEYTKIKCESPIEKVLTQGKIFELGEHTILVSKSGIEQPIEDSAAPIRDEEGNINGAVLIFRDFTEKKEKQDRIEYLSYHDQLTGLYNRRYWEEALTRIDNDENYPLSVVLVDVNGLKMINDAFGHVIGDKVLQRTAEVMLSECRTKDIIARIGGDEFVIMMPGTDASEVEVKLQQMVSVFENQAVGSVNISVSYGWGVKQEALERMSDIFKVAEDHMYRRKLSESKSMRYKTIEIILRTLHEKSEREKRHSESVSILCEKIGIAMGLDTEDIKELKTAGRMHDIGKIAIDLSILDKPGALTATERIEIERHPEQGYQILRSISEFAKMAEYVLAHHERWDGSGYPGKLKGEEIPLEARIIAIADSYHAMICDRPYRKAMSKEAAVEEINRCSGSQFDPVIVELFIQKVVTDEDLVHL